MAKTAHNEHRPSHRSGGDAAVMTRAAGGAALGATIGTVAGLPGTIIGGLIGAGLLVSAPRLLALHRQ
jgi:hypothetical protein